MGQLPASVSSADGVHSYKLVEFKTTTGVIYYQYVHDSYIHEGCVSKRAYTDYFPSWNINRRELECRLLGRHFNEEV